MANPPDGFVPPDKEREVLAAALATAVRAVGGDRFVRGALVDPRHERLDSLWDGRSASLHRILARLHAHVGLDIAPAVTLHRPRPDDEPVAGQPPPDRNVEWCVWPSAGSAPAPGHREPATHHDASAPAIAYEADARLCTDPLTTLAGAARAVASAWIRRNRAPAPKGIDAAAWIDVVASALGMGVILTDASFLAARGARPRRAAVLGPQASAFLLACQAHARGLDARARKQLGARLQPNQSAFFAAALRVLDDEPGPIERLSLPARDRWPRPIDPSTLTAAAIDARFPPPVGPTHDPNEAAAPSVDSVRGANVGRAVFRVRGSMAMRLMRVAMLATFLIGGFVALPGVGGGEIQRGHIMVYGLCGALFAVAIGWFIRDERCSDPKCSTRLPRGATTCPHCGGTIAGEIRDARERLEAQERLADPDHDRPSPERTREG